MKRTALFPGSFDPFTAGHLNILKRALTMFDEVVVAVGVNIDKRGFFSNEKKIDIIRQARENAVKTPVVADKALKKSDKKAYREAIKFNEEIEISQFVCKELDKFSSSTTERKLRLCEDIYAA